MTTFKIPEPRFKVGDIVQGAYDNGPKRYVIVEIRYPWVRARRINGGGDSSSDVMFPLRYMLRKAA